MVTIRYRLTPEDLAELDARRHGGICYRAFRIAVGAFIGVLGLTLAWPSFLIPWHPWTHWFGNLAILGLGIFILWMGLDSPGLMWLSHRFSDPYAECEVRLYEGKVVCSRAGKTQQFRWFPKRGFRENEKFFLLRALDAKFAIPKRALTTAQDYELRALVQPANSESDSDTIECNFFLTHDELNEASVTPQGWFQRWLKTPYGRLTARAVCGLGAIGVLFLPGRLGSSWAQEFRTEPGVAAGIFGFELLWLFVAAGCPGLKSLNRLDLERRIRISELVVEVTRGARTSTYPWKRFLSYQETPNLFVLRTRIVVQFWTIPKRALRPRDDERLRSLLDRKLPQK